MYKTPLKLLEPGLFVSSEYRRPVLPLAQTSNFLPVTATLYEPLWRKRSLSIITLGTYSVQRELELMLEWIKPQANQTILDAACSAGLYARTLLSHANLQVHAIDYSLPFLKKAKQYAQADNLSPVLIQADVSHLPYQDKVVDAIVCGGSLNEFINLPEVLKEFARVLKPGGIMWQMYIRRAKDPVGRTVQGLLRLSGIRFIDPETFEQQCLEQGFYLVKTQYQGPIVMALFKLKT